MGVHGAVIMSVWRAEDAHVDVSFYFMSLSNDASECKINEKVISKINKFNNSIKYDNPKLFHNH
jgi:hypothetical protein